MLKMGSEKKKKRSRASTKSMISFNDIESMLLNLALVSALALHEEEGDGPMLLDRAMKDAGVASPGTRLRVLGFLMHTSLSEEDLEHRERRWMADNTDESTKVIAE